MLYHPEDETSIEGMTSTQFDHKQTIQRNLEMRIQELLYPIIGAGKVIAKVNADLDFNQRTIRKELYDPDSAVIRSEQKSEETTRGSANLEAGTPDANFRGDGIGGSISQQNSTRETSTLNYEINKEEQNIVTLWGRWIVSVLRL